MNCKHCYHGNMLHRDYHYECGEPNCGCPRFKEADDFAPSIFPTIASADLFAVVDSELPGSDSSPSIDTTPDSSSFDPGGGDFGGGGASGDF